MPPKRRFWKTEQEVGRVFSMEFRPGFVIDTFDEMFAPMGEIREKKG